VDVRSQAPPSRVSRALAADRLGVWPVVAIVGGAIAPLTVVAGGALSALTSVVVGLYAFFGWEPLVKLFFWQTVIGGFGVLVLMVIASAATAAHFAARDSRHDIVGVGQGVIAPALSVLALGEVMILTLEQFHKLLGVDATSPLRWAFPALYAVAFALGLARAGYLAAVRPRIYAAIGTGKPPVADA